MLIEIAVSGRIQPCEITVQFMFLTIEKINVVENLKNLEKICACFLTVQDI